MNNEEKLVSAAIRYKKKRGIFYHYVYGKTHGECFFQLLEMGLPSHKRNMKKETKGFWTTKGRFVNRKEAKQIALNACQISSNYEKEELFSNYVRWYAIKEN